MTTFCSSCGTATLPGASFCSVCGQKVVVPQVNCPTCGQVWSNAPVVPSQGAASHVHPTSSAQAWPSPSPSPTATQGQFNDPVDLGSFPAPTTVTSPTSLNSFPPPQPALTTSSIKQPFYGKYFVEGKHCGNCGAANEQGVLECTSCQTNDFAKIPGAQVKGTSLNTDSKDI